jgi:hypothetical protein
VGDDVVRVAAAKAVVVRGFPRITAPTRTGRSYCSGLRGILRLSPTADLQHLTPAQRRTYRLCPYGPDRL